MDPLGRHREEHHQHNKQQVVGQVRFEREPEDRNLIHLRDAVRATSEVDRIRHARELELVGGHDKHREHLAEEQGGNGEVVPREPSRREAKNEAEGRGGPDHEE